MFYRLCINASICSGAGNVSNMNMMPTNIQASFAKISLTPVYRIRWVFKCTLTLGSTVSRIGQNILHVIRKTFAASLVAINTQHPAFYKHKYNNVIYGDGNYFKAMHLCDYTPATHYSNGLTSAMASQITGLLIVYSAVCSNADQRKHQSSSLASLRGIHRWLGNSPHKRPETWKMLPFDDVIMMACKVHE